MREKQNVEDHEMSRVGNIHARNPPGAGICLQVAMWILLKCFHWGGVQASALLVLLVKKRDEIAQEE